LIFFLAPVMAALAATPPKTVSGGTPVRLKAISSRFQRMVDEGQLAGAVLLLAHHNQVVLHNAVGFQNIETKTPMGAASIFQIMSQTVSNLDVRAVFTTMVNAAIDREVQ